jgi:hypothetical protein
MAVHRPGEISDDTAERLLAGEQSGPPRLVRLLHAASAPPRDHELSGEEIAVAAYRRRGAKPARLALRPAVRAAWASAFGVKLALAALATGAAGIALAAGVGVLPNPLHVGVPSNAVQHGATGPRVVAPKTAGSGNLLSPSVSLLTGPPSPDTVGLCEAYLAKMAINPGAAKADPVFDTLATLAGGSNNVADYCTLVVTWSPTPNPSSWGKHPSGHPTPHPTGSPSHHGGGGSTLGEQGTATTKGHECPTSVLPEASQSSWTGQAAVASSSVWSEQALAQGCW